VFTDCGLKATLATRCRRFMLPFSATIVASVDRPFVTAERTLVSKEFHARGPATEKALSLRRKLVLVH